MIKSYGLHWQSGKVFWGDHICQARFSEQRAEANMLYRSTLENKEVYMRYTLSMSSYTLDKLGLAMIGCSRDLNTIRPTIFPNAGTDFLGSALNG